MKTVNRFIGIIVIGCFVLCTASVISAQDWPQWRGTNRDGKVSGFNTPEKWPGELKRKWSVTVGLGDATPALVNGNLYVFSRKGANEVLQCLDAGNGKKLWEDKYAAVEVTGPAKPHPGPRSSPTVARGKVVALGVGGVLSCLDAATGNILWRNEAYTDAVPDFFTSMSSIVVDDMCIVHLGGKVKGTLLALDLATGGEIWKLDCEGPAYGSPVQMTVGGTRQIVVLSEKHMFGVATKNGRLLWQIATPNERYFFSCATPIIAGDTIYLTGQGYGTKAVKVTKGGDEFTVATLWSNDELGTTFNTPVLNDNLLFGVSKIGYLYCIDAKTGKTAWVDTTKLDRFASVLDAGSVLLGLSLKSELIVFEPDGKAYAELAKFKVAETPTRAHPVVAGNRIYVKDEETLAMWTLE